ncbi:MAG: aspartate aminotransferase family protein [Proteobacteria bacterium]|nr:aspartate aminotransferase family protein [Pseudomonadota bacterium]
MTDEKDRTQALLQDAAQRGIRYRVGLNDRGVAPAADAVAAVERFREPLPDIGAPDEETLALLDEIGSPATVAMAGPRYFGFVIGGSLPVTLATNWLTAAWDQCVGLHEVTPAASTLEQVAIEWLIDLFGLPEASGAGFVTGATVANFTALAAARHRVCMDAGWDVEGLGLTGSPPISVLVGEEAHPTLTKSLGLLGLGRNRVVRMPVDGQGRIIVSQIPAVEGPTIVCTQAGNVNTGAFDPIGEICAAVRPAGAWVHVDGAFGLWAAVSPQYRHLTEGVGQADSWATDAHKWLNVPYDSGLAFVRQAEDLKAAMSITAEYLLTESEYRNPSDYTPELSRRARGVDVWAALRSLGRSGLVELVDRCCRHARRFAAGFTDAGFEILNDVVLNQVLVAFGDDATTRRIIDEIQRDGTCWCGVTVWQGKTAMRISICNWSTTDADVDVSLKAMIAIARRPV